LEPSKSSFEKQKPSKKPSEGMKRIGLENLLDLNVEAPYTNGSKRARERFSSTEISTPFSISPLNCLTAAQTNGPIASGKTSCVRT
jgi:hypothetical protein